MFAELAVDIFAMPNFYHMDQQNVIFDRIHNTIAPDANPIASGLSCHFLVPRGSRILGQGANPTYYPLAILF